MSTYTEYVKARLEAQREEEEEHKNDATVEDYEAALERLGVTT